jgi:hypothetical protein
MEMATLLRKYDPYPTPDVRDVVDACDALHVREIKLFRLAFARWFGRDPSEPELERPFMHYLFAHQAPMWVRQFAREVLLRKTEGVLDPVQFGLPPRTPQPEGDGPFETACRVLLVVAWGVIIAIIARSSLWDGFWW